MSPEYQAGQHDDLDDYADRDVPLQSTTIRWVYYDRDAQDLHITFTSGKTYTLAGVPPDKFLGLVHASSPGRYFNDELRGQYT